jgi:hypothetical protein
MPSGSGAAKTRTRRPYRAQVRRDLDQLIADAEAASRVHEPIALEEGDEKERGGATPGSSGAARRPPLYNAR